MWMLGLIMIAVVMIAPVWAIVAIHRQRRELEALRGRLDAIEGRITAGAATPAAMPPPAVPAPAPPLATPAQPWTPATPAPAPAPQRRFDGSSAEELIGSVWLQNVGAVLLLLGVFFLILWGYTTGRFGPGVLVGAGVVLGLAFVWRGDRMARFLPPFGHALIGVGLGTVYLSLYLGHFTLHALSAPLAFVLLTLVSVGTVAVGLRYRVQSIAGLGLMGAFVPQIMAAWIPLRGFSMSQPGLLGYLAAMDAAVFLLAARAGWSGIDLAALFLSAAVWNAQFWDAPWGWGIQMGLTAVFVALGLSPLPRLVGSGPPVRGIDLAAIAAAPFCLIAASWPLLARMPATTAAMYLAGLAVVYLAAALWVDARRAERDLWRPLTGAAVVLLTGALERALGPEHTPLAWCVEGTLLVWLGLRPRGVWLRFCGYAVTMLGMIWFTMVMSQSDAWERHQLPILHPPGLRNLACLIVVMAGAWLLGRGRSHLTTDERSLPEFWSGVGNVMLLFWTARESGHLATWLTSAGDPSADRTAMLRARVLAASFTSAGWLLQAVALLVLGWTRPSPFMRWFALGLAGITVLKFLIVDLQTVDVFWRFLTAIVVGAALLGISYGYQRRARRVTAPD